MHPWKHGKCCCEPLKFFTQWQRVPGDLVASSLCSELPTIHKVPHINLSEFKISCLKVKNVSKHDTLPNSILGVLKMKIWNGIQCWQKRFVQCSCVSQVHLPVNVRNCTGCSFSPLWNFGLFSPPPLAALPPPTSLLQFHPFFHLAVDVGRH